jgi:Terminase RNaseH-like domain
MSEIARLGERHPTIRTQYELEAITGAGRLFPPALLEAIQGTHPRSLHPDEGRTYVAGVDVAGQVSEDGKPLLNDTDETVVTIAEVDWRDTAGSLDQIPTTTVVHHIAMKGLTHPVQQKRLQAALFGHWNVARVAIDATGVGAGTAAYLAASHPTRVDPIAFTAPEKSRLGYELLAAAETGRLSLYSDPGDHDATTCIDQLRGLTYELKTGELMSWQARADGHDDYATSLALTCRAAAQSSPPAAGGLVRGQDTDVAAGQDGSW